MLGLVAAAVVVVDQRIRQTHEERSLSAKSLMFESSHFTRAPHRSMTALGLKETEYNVGCHRLK